MLCASKSQDLVQIPMQVTHTLCSRFLASFPVTHRGSDTGWHHLHGTYWYTVSLGPCKGLCMLWKIHKYVHLNAIIFLSALLRSYRSPLNILRLSSFNQQCQKNGKVPKWSAVNYYPLSCFWISWFLSLEKGKWERFPIPLPQENFLSKSSSWIMLHFS